VNKPITCPELADPYCYKAWCNATVGCVFNTTNCWEELGYDNRTLNNTCTVPVCNGSCYESYICVPPPPPSGSETFPVTVVALSVSSGAIAGICLAAAAVFAAAGGGAAFAFAGGAGAGGATAVFNNPTYVPSGASGSSPLYKPND